MNNQALLTHHRYYFTLFNPFIGGCPPGGPGILYPSLCRRGDRRTHDATIAGYGKLPVNILTLGGGCGGGGEVLMLLLLPLL
jgi:hypothetical protein